MRYEVYIHESLLQVAPKADADRRLVMDFVRWLGEHPFTPGDYTDTDAVGRRREVKIVGRYAITFWAEHAVKEVKVVNIQAADL